MLPDRVSNPGPLTYESGALPIAIRGPAFNLMHIDMYQLIPKITFNEMHESRLKSRQSSKILKNK